MRSLDEVRQTASEVGRPFWAALEEGRLTVPRCRACDRLFFYPRRHCPHCLSIDIGWQDASGLGRVFALTTVHVTFPGVTEEDLPLMTGLVDLDEGVRVAGRFAADAAPAVGARVRLSERRLDGFPVFLPESAAA